MHSKGDNLPGRILETLKGTIRIGVRVVPCGREPGAAYMDLLPQFAEQFGMKSTPLDAVDGEGGKALKNVMVSRRILRPFTAYRMTTPEY